MPDLRKSFLVLVLFGLLAVTACGVGAKPIPTLSHDFTTSTPAANYPTAMPTFTPTPAVLGSLENPIVIAMVNSSPSAEQQTAFNDLASLLGGQLQMTVIGLQHISRTRICIAAPAGAFCLASTRRVSACFSEGTCHSAPCQQPPGCHG